MEDDEDASPIDRREWKGMRGNGVSGAGYGLGFVGAVIYYIQRATTFWAGVLGFFKALVWPALLIYRALALLAKQLCFTLPVRVRLNGKHPARSHR